MHPSLAYFYEEIDPGTPALSVAIDAKHVSWRGLPGWIGLQVPTFLYEFRAPGQGWWWAIPRALTLLVWMLKLWSEHGLGGAETQKAGPKSFLYSPSLPGQGGWWPVPGALTLLVCMLKLGSEHGRQPKKSIYPPAAQVYRQWRAFTTLLLK